jgi:hypothetical protein
VANLLIDIDESHIIKGNQLEGSGDHGDVKGPFTQIAFK